MVEVQPPVENYTLAGMYAPSHTSSTLHRINHIDTSSNSVNLLHLVDHYGGISSVRKA